MSGWVNVRQQPSSAVWGGYASSVIGAPGQAASGWVIIRQQPSSAVWGGYAAVSNIAPVSGAAAAPSGFQDRRPGYLKKRILLGI